MICHSNSLIFYMGFVFKSLLRSIVAIQPDMPKYNPRVTSLAKGFLDHVLLHTPLRRVPGTPITEIQIVGIS